MSAQVALQLPGPPSTECAAQSKKQMLKKDIFDWLKKNDLSWQSRCLEAGSTVVNGLTDCLRYLDGQHSTLEGRIFWVTTSLKKSRHRRRSADSLSAGVQDHHCTMLNSFSLHAWMQPGRWKAIRSAVCSLEDSLAKYCSILG